MSHLQAAPDRAFVLRTLLFENWLRFTFIVENDPEHFSIRLPSGQQQALENQYPLFAPLVAALNTHEIIYEDIQNSVLNYVQTQLGARTPQVLEDPQLEKDINVLHVWIQSHEAMLEDVRDFAHWESLFALWKTEQGLD